MARKAAPKAKLAVVSLRPRAQPPAAPRKRVGVKPKPKRSGGLAHMAVDARKAYHMSAEGGHYTVIRGRVQVPITASTTNNTVVILGQYINATSETVTGNVGVYGTGTGAPGTALSTIADPYVGNIPEGGAQVALHAVTAELTCLGPAAAGAAIPVGVVNFGTLSGRVRRSTFTSWDAVFTTLSTRSELNTYTAYELMNKEAVRHAYPIDLTQYRALTEFTTVWQSSELRSTDTLAPIVLCVPTHTNATPYMLTVYTEWRVNYAATGTANSQTNLLATTHIHHRPPPPNFWETVRGALGTAAGALPEIADLGRDVAMGARFVRGALSSFVRSGAPRLPLGRPMVRPPLALMG